MLSLSEKFLLEILRPDMCELGGPAAVHLRFHINNIANVSLIVSMISKFAKKFRNGRKHTKRA